jgi:hypothetical protein
MFIVPSMAIKPSDPIPISYFKETLNVDLMEMKTMPSESSVFYIVTRAELSGLIYDYSNNEIGPALFDFAQVGKYVALRSESESLWMQVWHFDLEMTSITMDGGFRGILNGKAYQTADLPGIEPFTVKGVLQGFGDDFKGKKLVVEMVRGPEPVITGVLIEN